MLRILTGWLFSLLVIISVCASFVVGVETLLEYNTRPMAWICFIPAMIVFIMSCVGLFILITTKASITISKQFVVGKQSETIKPAKKAKRK